MANTTRFWPNQPGSTRIEADSARIEPRQRESEEKKRKEKKETDARATASNVGAAPLVPCPCFLDIYTYAAPFFEKNTLNNILV